MQEDMLRDLVESAGMSGCALRYFNPAGAHSSHRLGEVSHASAPCMLVPKLREHAMTCKSGLLSKVPVFGDDYDSKDGTAVRDYIHIEDLADAHLVALQHLLTLTGCFHVFNLGTGQGRTVLEVLSAYQSASGVQLQTKIEKRRAGDAAFAVADPSRANQILRWQAKRDFQEIVSSDWEFALENPHGYGMSNSNNICSTVQFPLAVPFSHGGMNCTKIAMGIQQASTVVGSLQIQQAEGAEGTSEKYVVDLGGTNLRVFRFWKDGYEGAHLTVPEQLKSKWASADDLFDFIASALVKIVKSPDSPLKEPLPLHLVFSFALTSGEGKVVLKHWAKEWATSGVEGMDLVNLMDSALRRQNLPLKVQSVMNDCVSGLFALRVVQSTEKEEEHFVADAAVVVGTGTNACYVDASSRVISTEWAGLTRGLPIEMADISAHTPHNVNLERMVSCLYLPRIVEELCPDAGRLSMKDLMVALQGSETPLKSAAYFVISRSAMICAKALAAVIAIAATSKSKSDTFHVVVDGALFQCIPMYLALVKHFLSEASLHVRVKLHLVKDAASIGAWYGAGTFNALQLTHDSV